MTLNIIAPGKLSKELQEMLDYSLLGLNYEFIRGKDDLINLQNSKIVFVVELNEVGVNISLLEMFNELFSRDKHSLSGSTGAILIHSSSELHTKSFAQNVIFLANQLGCNFLGHSIVEAIEKYKNFLTWQKRIEKPLKDICLESSRSLITRLVDSNKHPHNNKLLVLHASSRITSNTLMLWGLVEKHLQGIEVKIHHLENGKIIDCIGCSFKTCSHFSNQRSCFYGGVVVEEIYPAIEEADSILFICPNYNDALSANLTATINRLTALYRKISFYEKSIFSIIVSGNSGSDSVAKQLIGALNINKGFQLPPYFSLMSIANDPGSILQIDGIECLAQSFANNIMDYTKGFST